MPIFRLSHYIRGKKGNAATDRDIELNCQQAIVAGKILELTIPSLRVYVPGEHDEFVTKAYRKHYLTVDDILTVDCELLGKRDLLIVYNHENYLSNGMVIEVNYAKEHNIPIYSMSEVCERTTIELQGIVESIRLKKKQVNEYLS